MDNVSTIIKLQEKNLARIEKNRSVLIAETQKFNETKKVYDEILKREDINDKAKQKYYLEYVFLFEQYNLKKLPIDNFIKRSDMYSKRLDKLLDYIELSKGENPSYSILRSKLYGINSVIINEAVCYYDGLIEKYKQDKLMNSKFLEYINYLKSTNEDYSKYSDFVPTEEEIETMSSNIKKAEIEKDILIDVFRNEKFIVDEDNIMSLSKADIPDVIDIMYPAFKEKLDSLGDKEKGRQVA